MIDPLSNQYINWTDGMKISSVHLHKLQHVIEEKVKDCTALSEGRDHYGILPFGNDGRKPLEFMLRVEGQSTVVVEVVQCRGLSPAGDRIEVLTGAAHEGRTSLQSKVEHDKASLINISALYVAIRCSGKEMQPFGLPDSGESPARLPYASPELKIELIPADKDPNLYRNSLIIGRLNVNGGVITQDEDYIPPSLAMSGQEALKEFSFKYVRFIREMEENAFGIVRNLGRKDTLTSLATSTGSFARNIIECIQRNFDFVQMYGDSLHPSRFLLNAKQLARSIFNAVELLPGDEKEELLQYFRDVIELGPAEYTAVNKRLIDIDYNHLDLREILGDILEFCKVNGKLVSELSRLDYIGKKKKTGIFVGEVTKESETPKPKKRWDF